MALPRKHSELVEKLKLKAKLVTKTAQLKLHDKVKLSIFNDQDEILKEAHCPFSGFKPIDLDFEKFIRTINFGEEGNLVLEQTEQFNTLGRLLSKELFDNENIIIQSQYNVDIMHKLAAVSALRKYQPFIWCNVSEYDKKYTPDLDKYKIIIVAGISSNDGYNKKERLRDILNQGHDKTVYLLYEDLDGITSYTDAHGDCPRDTLLSLSFDGTAK